MTKQKHTPGPWILGHELGDGFSIVRQLYPSNPQLLPVAIATFTKNYNTENEDVAKANAHLIAASPDLLDACKEALIEIHQIHSHYLPDCKEGCPSHHVADLLRQAITKAEGRTP